MFPRSDHFGGIIYVHSRNDFFFADIRSFELISRLASTWTDVLPKNESAYIKLASLGICEIEGRRNLEDSYSGPSFIGEFDDIPKVGRPLVLNCFATAHCPLMCRYCHADDLMKPFRERESMASLTAVVESARRVDSLVAVITGGDPLTRPERTSHIIKGISNTKPIVLDTSGVPNSREEFRAFLPTLVDQRVHVRISLDGFSRENDKARPINRQYIKFARSAYDQALQTLKELLQAGVPVTIQTVLSNINDQVDNLVQFAQTLDALGVRHWVLHVALAAGRARGIAGRSVLPNKPIVPLASRVIREVQKRGLRLDVRVTNANPVPYVVFLVGSEGDLFTEGFAKFGKKRMYYAEELGPQIDIWRDVDPKAHTARYANWVEGLYPGKDLSELTIKLPGLS